VSAKWKSSIPIAGVAVVAALAFPGIASAAVTANVAAGGVLNVTGTGSDAITITCDGGGNVAVANATVTPATACNAITAINVTGGDGANVITLTGVTAAAYSALTQTTINAGAGDDQIFGSERVDEMHGGAGNDQIIGDDNPANTRDVFEGEAGDDVLIWRGGEDDDTMNGGDGADSIQVNGAGVAEAFTVKPSTTAGRVSFDRLAAPGPGPFNLDIGTAERLELNANGGDDKLDSDPGLDALGIKLDIRGGDGNDTLDGGDGADLIAGEAGNDTITLDDNPVNTRDIALGGDGDDTMTWNGGDDDDVNDGGAGNDTVTVNGAAAPEAFTLNASATAGHATFDRAATPGPGPFNIDIVASERLDLNTNGGDDKFTSDGAIAALGLRADVEGGDGNDTLDGSDAADLLDGGIGNDQITPDDNPAGTRDDARGGDGDDTITWNGGDDDDLNEGGAGNDTSEVNGAAVAERFTIKPSPTAGRVLFDRLATPGPGAFNVDIGTTERLHLEANAGNDRITGAKGVKGRITTVLNAGDGNDRVRGTDAVDAISLGKGNDIASTIDKAEDTLSCDQGIDLAFVDRRDFLRRCELVIGGLRRVAIKGKPQLDGNRVALRLRCVATEKCKSVVKLKRNGKVLGRAKVTIKRGKSRSIKVALNQRGRRVLSDGARVKVEVQSKDKQGNGWRSTKTVRLG
jgi:Ca2+-binding RTX toxin-like protein